MRFFTLITAFFAPFFVLSQTNSSDSTDTKPHISGSADAYYRYNEDAPAGLFNNFTKFTNTQNAFALGMASIKLTDTLSKVSGVVNLGFGPRVNEYNYTDASNSLIGAIKELYASYSPTKEIKFTVGKWYKHLGYEVVDAYANPNYSMSYAFTYGPMSYTGVRAEVVVARSLSFLIGVANPADITNISYSPTKTILAGVGFHTADNRLKIKLNFQGYGGISKPYLVVPGYYLYNNLQQYDAVIQFAATKKLDIVYNGTIQNVNDGSSRDWNSNLLYFIYKWKAGFSTALRGEYLRDGGALKIGTNVFAATLSSTFSISNRLHIIPEIRYDKSPDAIFFNKSVAGTGNTITGLLAVAYGFGK